KDAEVYLLSLLAEGLQRDFFNSLLVARLRTNLMANFVGAGWSGAVQLAATPIFIDLLGMEAFGLIGFFLAIQMALQALDLGFSATVNRELARYSAQSDQADEARDLVRTFEGLYWPLGLAIGVAIVLLAPQIASGWL